MRNALIGLGAALLAASATSSTPEFKVIDREVNKTKNQVYLQVELKTAPKSPDPTAIELLRKSLDTEGARKFAVFVHPPGKAGKGPYASCGRLPNGKLEANVF